MFINVSTSFSTKAYGVKTVHAHLIVLWGFVESRVVKIFDASVNLKTDFKIRIAMSKYSWSQKNSKLAKFKGEWLLAADKLNYTLMSKSSL